MIIVKEVENEKHFPQCTGCGNVEDSYIHIEVKDIIDGTEEHLTLCPTCKATLIRELLSSQNPGDFKNVKFVLEEEISVLRRDLECIEEKWIHKFGSPLTEERILKYKDSALSIAYLNFINLIKDCETIISVT